MGQVRESMWKVSRSKMLPVDCDYVYVCVCVCVLSHFSCVWLFCDPMDYNLPGSSVHSILQASILESVARPFSKGSFWSRDVIMCESESEVAQSCLTLCSPLDCTPLCPWGFPGKSTGVGCHFLLQGIFPTQGLNLGLRSLCRNIWGHIVRLWICSTLYHRC